MNSFEDSWWWKAVIVTIYVHIMKYTSHISYVISLMVSLPQRRCHKLLKCQDNKVTVTMKQSDAPHITQNWNATINNPHPYSDEAWRQLTITMAMLVPTITCHEGHSPWWRAPGTCCTSCGTPAWCCPCQSHTGTPPGGWEHGPWCPSQPWSRAAPWRSKQHGSGCSRLESKQIMGQRWSEHG